MLVRRGDIVMSDFGKGSVVAITKSFVIHEIEDGTEVALYREHNWICVPAEFPKEDVDDLITLDLPELVDPAK